MSIEMSARIGALISHSAAASGADSAALEAEAGFAATTALDPDAPKRAPHVLMLGR